MSRAGVAGVWFTRVTTACVAALLLVGCAFAQEPAPSLRPLLSEPPLRVTLEASPRGGFVAGVRAPVRLVVRNVTGSPGLTQTPVAVVLRGVTWKGCPPDRRSWLHPVMGDVREMSDGALVLDTSASRLSEVMIESALIFPGQQVVIDMPYTPQRAGMQKVDISYGVVGPGETWADRVWCARGGEGRFQTWPRATSWEIDAMQGSGGAGVVRQSMRASGTPIELHHETWSVLLSGRADPKGLATGGLNADRALEKVGWAGAERARPKAQVWRFWRPSLSAWFFVRDDGSAVALRREGGRWEREPMPAMAVTVPEAFGAAPDGATDMLLKPEIFGDLVEVREPLRRGRYDIGASRVEPSRIWAVLRRALAQRVDLRYETFNASGLGNEQVLSAGVRLDHQGRWLP